MTSEKQQNEKKAERPPIVVVLGHVDHGKSTLLDYIRKANTVAGEAGGITQRTSAYEVKHAAQGGKTKKITFLDTPGHGAFALMRERGARIADIAILVVAADDGVKAQTVEALNAIGESGIPFIVALNKIDRPNAAVEKAKQELAERGVYLEGYGGDVPVALISAKTGEGVPELLDLLLLVAELEELKGDPGRNATGYVLESHRNPQIGISATLIVTDGTLAGGMTAASGEAVCPIRRMENFLGETAENAQFSSPVQVIGWNKLPRAGDPFESFARKREAEEYIEKKHTEEIIHKKEVTGEKADESAEIAIVPVIAKADTVGTLEAVIAEIKKINVERVRANILHKGVGGITESDVKRGEGKEKPIVVGFSVKVENAAARLAEQRGITICTFDIIYKLTEWLEEELAKRRPSVRFEEKAGEAKIIRVFSAAKTKQIVGGKVTEGKITTGAAVKILRRGFQIGSGKIIELQHKKEKTAGVEEGLEFGAMIDAKQEVAAGDAVEAYTMVER